MQETPEKREIRLYKKKLYRESNRDKINADKLRHYHENQERLNAKTKEWQKLNPDKVKATRKKNT